MLANVKSEEVLFVANKVYKEKRGTAALCSLGWILRCFLVVCKLLFVDRVPFLVGLLLLNILMCFLISHGLNRLVPKMPD